MYIYLYMCVFPHSFSSTSCCDCSSISSPSARSGRAACCVTATTQRSWWWMPPAWRCSTRWCPRSPQTGSAPWASSGPTAPRVRDSGRASPGPPAPSASSSLHSLWCLCVSLQRTRWWLCQWLVSWRSGSSQLRSAGCRYTAVVIAVALPGKSTKAQSITHNICMVGNFVAMLWNSMTWSVAATCVDVSCPDLSMQVQIKTGLSHSRWIKCIFKLNLYACD